MNNEKNSNEAALFGQRLRLLRKKHRISQKKLAEKCGYKRSTSMSNIEKGNALVRISSLIAIAELLDIDLHWLITGKPSEQVRLLKPFAVNHLADHYQELQNLEKERADLSSRQALGEIHTVRLDEIETQIINRRMYCEAVCKAINKVLVKIDEKI